MVDSLDDQKRREIPTLPVTVTQTIAVAPFPITWLYSFASAMPIGACNDHSRADLAYHKARLVEVVKIAVQNAVFRPHVLN
jgi:hypothetical protein